jgi:uncharacterized membrane protein
MSIPVTIVAVVFLMMGIAAFMNPRNLLTRYVGISAETADARNEIQAVYGGFGVAIAVVLMLPIWMPEARIGVIIAVAGSLMGMAGGRIIAALRERPGRWPLVFFVVESTGAALLLGVL